MKNRIGIVVLVVLCLGLGIALITTRKAASDREEETAKRLGDYSNQVVQLQGTLDNQKQVNAMLEKDRDLKNKTLADLTNNLTRVSANLTEVSGSLNKTEEALKTSQQEIAKRETRISELESQNQALDKRSIELTNAITGLSSEIAETQRKLNASEGDKKFLESQLKRLMSEKAELERQFNDLAAMKAQVAKLKEEMRIARRIEMLRRTILGGPDDEKGAEALVAGLREKALAQAKAHATEPSLNVEVNADGSVKVIPPLNKSSTNAPAAK